MIQGLEGNAVEITNDHVGAKHGDGLIKQPGGVCGVR
jgi:hypothetical protein